MALQEGAAQFLFPMIIMLDGNEEIWRLSILEDLNLDFLGNHVGESVGVASRSDHVIVNPVVVASTAYPSKRVWYLNPFSLTATSRLSPCGVLSWQ